MSKSKTFSRKELYDLVWSKPMISLAKQFGLSDVGLAKACKKANISRPPRGYWAKLAVGKRVSQQHLLNREPGMSNEVTIGGSHYDNHYDRRTDAKILNSNPIPPTFDETIDEVKAKTEARFKKITMPRFPENAHHVIRRLLEKDEERRAKHLASSYPFDWDKPIFDEPFEKRRLKILNAIFTALEIAGMKPTIRNTKARELSVQVNDTIVEIWLEDTSVKPKRYTRDSIVPKGKTGNLCLVIFRGGPAENIRRFWEDNKEDGKLEKRLRDIVVSIIVAGEEQYRESCQWRYKRDIERKESLIKEILKRKEEAARKEQDRKVAIEEARIDRLLSDADAMRKASEIRQYIDNVITLWKERKIGVAFEEITRWKSWAEAQADRIDPVKSGKFLESLSNLNKEN
ncbi:hypothetical protein NBZ79_00525 [Sneathiella marina]|uniref:Uncharacterized protein n=1 Tax=Sneathiella marina TaxID=2950108 RepID=A0ABY4W856_9PROT|nr:hypothetical protein [Sneathiella marina]USG61459.1 hypothetical protein NBZ79_00525 [Sneathiella marina]